MNKKILDCPLIERGLKGISEIRKRCQVVLCGNDYDRIKYALDYYKSNTVFLVTNKEPWKEHEKHDTQVKIELMRILKEMGFHEKEIQEYSVNYYRFDEALVSLFKLMLSLEKEYEIILNITGGTKLLATAAVISAMLINVEPIYIAAKEYSAQLNAPGKGFAPQPIKISPLFKLSSILLPTDERKIALLEYLLTNGGAKTVVVMIPTSEFKGKDKLTPAELKKRKNALQSTYSYCIKQLIEANLVVEENRRFHLTQLGRLVAKLVQARKNVS